MEKPKILIVAPYRGLFEIALTFKNERKDVILDVVNGNLGEGVAIAVQMQKNGYDVIVSRGGTALEIKKAVNIPVVDIEFSAYDMMRILHMTDRLYARIAIVGYPSIAKCARIVSELMNRKVCVRTINNEIEAEMVVCELQKEQFNIIIGDQIVHNIAMKQNMNSILFLSGPESVNQSIDEAVRISRLTREYRRHIEYLYEILYGVKEKIYATGEDGKLLFDNWEEKNDVYEQINKMVLEKDSEQIRWLKKTDCVWRIRKYQVNKDHMGISACYGEKYSVDVSVAESVIQLKDIKTMPDIFYHKYYSNDEKMKILSDEVSIYGKSLLPVLLVGERGVGKTHMAYAMHKESSKRGQLFLEIECEDLDKGKYKQNWEHHKELLYNKKGGTIYFKDIDKLPLETQESIYQYISASTVKKNYRFIFSATSNIEEQMHKKNILKKLGKRISEFVLVVPPLRDRPSCIEGIVNMMIHEFNMQYGKQVIGFDSGAREKLREYYWPGNIDQLHRVVSECVLNCDGIHVSAEELEKKLFQEKYVSFTPILSTELDLKQPLERIVSDIIQIILKEENMNQTQTAKRLGIARSTLWRMLGNVK